MISFDKKFIFIHINKTAGTSMEKALSKYGVRKLEPKDNLEFELSYKQSQHFNCEEYKKYLGSEYDDYFKFTVVRNPFDRIVSYYGGGAITNNLSFSDWVIERYQNKNFKDFERMYSDYTHWIGDDKIDFILRFENLSSDFEELKNKLNLECELGYFNVNRRRSDYKEYYDENTKNIIYNFFEREIENFNYKF